MACRHASVKLCCSSIGRNKVNALAPHVLSNVSPHMTRLHLYVRVVLELSAIRTNLERIRWLPTAAAIALVFAQTAGIAAPTDAWRVIGQQGLVRFVVVPAEMAVDQAAYEEQIVKLCAPERTCFLNFYTNSTNADPTVPLPDAIANEATATYRRSMKNGVQVFLWSCRLKIPGHECF